MPTSVYLLKDTQPESCPPPETQVKWYSTQPLASVPGVALMVTELSPVASGATSQVAAFGEGAVLSAAIVIGAGPAVENKVLTSPALKPLL